MRRLGLLGGMSWESSALYYRLINEGVRDRLGGLHSADLVMASLDFAEIEALQAAGRWDDAGDRLAQEAGRLRAAGAEALVLCTNTMHRVAEQIEAAADIPMLHLGDVTGVAVRAAGVERVALLGTRFTMEQDFYRDRLTAHGLEVLVPEPADRAEVDRVIYEELVRGEVRQESRQRYQEVVARLIDRGAQGVILGCTEIELLLSAADVPVATFPTTRLHAAAAVDWALAGHA